MTPIDPLDARVRNSPVELVDIEPHRVDVLGEITVRHQVKHADLDSV
jgi:hypothetical protein